MWLDIVSEIAEKVLITIAPIIAGMIAAWIAGLLKQAWAKAHDIAGDEWQWALEAAARMAVQAAEQMELAGLIETKKDYAIATAQAYLNARGLKVDLLLVEAAIEQAVIDNFPEHKPQASLTGNK